MTASAPVTQIVDTLGDATESGPMKAGDLVETFGRSAVPPVLIVPGLLVASPLSGIPLFSSFCGFLIFLIAIQGAVGRDYLWLPGILTRRTVPVERTHNAAQKMRKVAGFLDKITRERLQWLVRRPMTRVLYLICGLAALSIPFLELVPFMSSIIGFGVALIAVAILAGDGLVAIFGLTVFAVASVIPFFIISTVSAGLG
ncbi:exopolysaccharide biosynthesis protein [Loktanella agnita]|uniref:exopolysaccharide biosynthesis protein n=1 Tax=Loktanella agnita TaxID=287097 RepID=UPI003987F462